MPIKGSVYIATSVDGFIATQDGGLDWLDRPEFSSTQIKGMSYSDFISDVDCLVMGRKTFDKVLTFGEWPYDGLPVIVLSGSNIEIPIHLHDRVKISSGTPQQIMERLEQEGKRHVYIDGGVTIQKFLDAGLIHEITITRIPVLLGGGISLFGSLHKITLLELLDVARSESGIVQERYQIKSIF